MKRKKTLALLLLFLLTVSFTLLVFTGCKDNIDGKQVPVYQGMSISSASNPTAYAEVPSVKLMSQNGNKNNGNHNGHYKGDHTGRDDMLDEENPFPENENIQEEIESSIDVIGSPNTIYYATPNEDIYICIHIDNPDSFEIISFTLNGQKYSSYMFGENSDMENIILKYNVGASNGIVEYTIDAIKYIDGTEIKDVLISGNKTVLAGIKTENQLTASASNPDISTDTLSFSVNVNDPCNLVAFSGGKFKAVLYDGTNIVAEKDIAVGNNTVSFNGLKSNTLYQYAIVGYYDDLSGDGFGMHILYKDAFYTDSVLLFDNVVIKQDGASFNFLWDENHNDKTVSSLKLYCGEALVGELDSNATSVSNLLSNTSYKLVAEYAEGENTESIQLEFTTLAKSIPSFNIANEIITKNSIDAEYAITDTDKVLLSYKIELFKGEILVSENAEKKISFKALNYYTDYTLRITYHYNLNDGKGETVSVFEKNYKTLVYINPTSCTVANTSAIRVGDIIFIQVGLDNPLSMTVQSVVINGNTCPVTGIANGNKVFVEILCNDSFTGGFTDFRVDNLTAKIDEITHTAIPETELCDNVFINGIVTVLGKYTTNSNFELIEWGVVNQSVYRVIKLNNPTGYSISLSNEDIVLHKIDDNTYYYEDTLELDYGSGGGWDNGYYFTVKYENQYTSGYAITNLDYSYEKSCYVLESDEIKYISSANDLLNMSGRHYFQMTNDIDLIGVDWTGASLQGVFDANGYSIKNLSIVGTNNNNSLFSSAHGIIQNLNIVNATIMTKYTGNSTNTACGIIVGTGHAIYIRNCNIDESSTINAVGIRYVGGICGYAFYNTRIENCQTRAQINADQQASVEGIANSENTQNALLILNCLYKYRQSTDNKAVMHNSYHLNEDVTIAQLNTKDFYTQTLGWSENIWDFPELDVENGKHPKLKH